MKFLWNCLHHWSVPEVFSQMPLPSLLFRFFSQPESLESLLVSVWDRPTLSAERRGGRGGLAACLVSLLSYSMLWGSRACFGFHGASKENDRVTLRVCRWTPGLSEVSPSFCTGMSATAIACRYTERLLPVDTCDALDPWWLSFSLSLLWRELPAEPPPPPALAPRLVPVVALVVRFGRLL